MTSISQSKKKQKTERTKTKIPAGNRIFKKKQNTFESTKLYNIKV